MLEAAEELGYHVNQLARGLMRNESGIVCLIVSVAICVLVVLCGYDPVTRELSKIVSPGVLEGIVSFGVWDHFRSLNSGLFRLKDFIWFGAIILVCLLGTSAILSSKRA